MKDRIVAVYRAYDDPYRNTVRIKDATRRIEMATRQEGAFVATDAAGNEYTVIMYRDTIDTATMHSHKCNQVPAELGELRTTDGRHVNYIAKGSYEIVDRKKIPITSDDPNAP